MLSGFGHKKRATIFREPNPPYFTIFTLFLFELGFCVNMKVLDNFVSFPMALI